MAFLISRTDVPVVPIGLIADEAFTVSADWNAVFITALRTGRGSGALLRGRIYIALNMVERVMAGAFTPEINQYDLTELYTTGAEFDRVTVYVDPTLANNSVILE